MRSPFAEVGASASNAVVAVVCPVPPFAIATVPVTFAAVPETLPVTLPVTSSAAAPEPSRRTIAEFVFEEVAAFASTAPAATFAAVCPPTRATVGEVAVSPRSPVS